MRRWKSTDAKPKTRFYWMCSRQLHGRQHSEIDGPDGHKHAVHKSCAKGPPAGYETWDDFYRENEQGARSTMSKHKDIIRRLRGGERSPVNLGALSEILASMEARLPAAPPEVTTTIDVAAIERWISHWYGGKWEMAADKIAIKDANRRSPYLRCATDQHKRDLLKAQQQIADLKATLERARNELIRAHLELAAQIDGTRNELANVRVEFAEASKKAQANAQAAWELARARVLAPSVLSPGGPPPAGAMAEFMTLLGLG